MITLCPAVKHPIRAARRVRRLIPFRLQPVPHLLYSLLLVLALAAIVVEADEELDFGLETNRLAGIELTGNETFADDDLKGMLRIQEFTWTRPLNVPTYQPSLIETQLRLLEGFYRYRGFHQVAVALDSISTPSEQGDVIHISVVEGPRTLIRKVVFPGRGEVAEEDLRNSMVLLEGQPAPADLNGYGGDIYAIRSVYRNQAFLDISIRPIVSIEPDTTAGGYGAAVIYQIATGPSYTAGRITLKGNAKTNDNLLQRELVIVEGKPLYWHLVDESQRQLLATGLFRDVEIIPVAVDSTLGVADLEVRVIERKPAFYELGVGVGSQERIRVLAAWAHGNLWGTGRRLLVRARASWNVEDVVGNPISFDQGQLNYRADIEYRNPRIRDSRYNFFTDLFIGRETRGESGINQAKHGVDIGTSWQASRRVTNSVFLGLKVTDPSVHPYAPDSVKVRFDESDVSLTQTRSLNWSVYIDHRDNMFQPTGGMYTIGSLKLAGGLLGGDYSFFRWSMSWNTYHLAWLGGTLATRVMVGGAKSYGKSAGLGPDGVPYDDRFFAGGASTVRGYGHNSLGPQITDEDELDELEYGSDVLLPDNPARGGNYILLTNLEWRIPLPVMKSWQLATVLFFEGGNVWASLHEVRLNGFRLTSDPGDPLDPGSTKAWDYRYSVGTGIRLSTPVGPVRVDVGFPLKRVRYVTDEIDRTDPKLVWHFSLGYPF